MQASMGAAPRFVSVVLAMLLAVTMLPAAGLQTAYADEPANRPATSGGDVALEGANGGSTAGGTEVADGGLRYVVADGAATLVGFEDGAALEGALAVPEAVSDGDVAATVKAVEVAEGQVADKVTALTLPQTVESVRTEGLAAALPALASIEVASSTAAEGDGNEAAAPEGGATAKAGYSSVAGMLFRSAEGQASSDGTAFAEDALELVWAPPAMVVARIPLECKAIASGAFVDAAALETVMSFGKMESIAAEKDDEGNVTKPGAFTDEQISRLTIVVPGTNYAVTGEGAERVSGSVALSEKTDMLEKRKAWFHHGFDTSQIIMGAPFGEIEGVNAVSDEGVMEDRSLVTPLENGKSHLELTPEEEAEKAARRGEDPEAGLSFSYQASMDLSVRWAGDRTATPAHIDLPAYAKVDGVTYQVTQIEPNAFEGAVFLSSVAIPEGVTAIGESAFAGCTNLKEVSLPSTLKTIDYAAFKGTAPESVVVPDSVTIVGGEAFAGCASLSDVRMGEGAMVASDAFASSPAEAYVQERSTPDAAVSEEQPASDGEQPASNDDGISAYASPPGRSELSSVYYSNFPAPTNNIGGAKERFLVSPYYDVYYMQYTCPGDPTHSPVHDYPVCPPHIKGMDSICIDANRVGASSVLSHNTGGHGNPNIKPDKDYPKVVTWNGKRCIQFVQHWCPNTTQATGGLEHTVYVPKDNVYLLDTLQYWNGTTDGAFATSHPWNGGHFNYASFTSVSHKLSVSEGEASGIAIDGISGGAWNSGGGVVSADSTHIITPKPGYTLGEVTVTGDGTTYDAATNTLTMGWADSTVSAELIPNDIKVTFNLPHAYVSGKTAGAAYGDDNVVWGEGDASNTMTIKTEATVGNTNGTTPMPNTTTISASGSQIAFKNGQGQDGYRVTITPHNGWQHLGMWALSYKDGENWVDDPSFTSMQSAVIDYTKEWRLTPIVTGVTYTITYDGNGSGNPVAGGSYQVGNGLATMPTPKRSGFWFAGWAWTNDQNKMITDPTDTNGFKGDSWYPGDDVDPDVPSFTISDSAYGNAELKAIWKPKTYKIRYDVSVTEKDDGTYWADTPDDDVFVHPDARTVVASASNPGSDSETWAFTKSPEDFRTQDGIDTSALFANGSYDEGAVNYELPEVPFEGYLYKGWTKQVKLPAGLSVSDPNDGPFLAFSADVAGKLWPNQWNLGDTEPEGTYVESTNLITLYGVWLRKGVVTVNLESSDPAEVAAGSVNDEASVKVNGANVENTHVQPIAYWQDRGLMLYREMGEPGHSITGLHDPISSDTKIADTRVVNSATKNRDFQAPTRTGFRFLGWGKAGASGGDDVLYIKYFENAEGAGDAAAGGSAAGGAHEQGFYLTPAGMERVLRWDTNGGDAVADEGQQETWDALWEIRTYQIELHVPASTVKNTNGNGWSEASYRWEQDVVTRPDGSSTVSSWRKAVKEWKYWDVFYVPYYDLNSPFNAYRGWFRGSIGDAGQFEFTDDDTFTTEDGQVHRKPVITEAQGRAQGQAADADNTFRVTAANLDPKKLWAGAAAGQETDLDNVTAPDGSIELWLYTEPVYINVTAPMGVFLANDEPYVVGSDPRMALEEEATFTVKESNQDLVLTSITATDIVEADVNQTTNQVDVKTTVDDTKSRETGMCYRMFDVKNDVATDPAGGDQTKWNLDNARIFWVSPSETVYPYVKSTNQDPGQHDMGKRVYFGFGGGKGAANHLGDNVVEDDPDRSDDGNLLGAFELKQNYTAGGLAGKDGYKVATDAEGTSYVYDATKDQYGKTVGTGEEARTVWYAWAAKPGDANGRLVLTPVGGGEDAHTVDVSAPLVWRDYSFYYGLDLDKCSFDLGAIQSMVEAEDAWGYNVGYKKPLVKLMFTFAVERVPNVSYGAVGLSGYGAGDGEADAGAAASLATRAGTAGGDVDAEAIVSVGPASAA